MNNSGKPKKAKPGGKATGTIIRLPDGRFQAIVTLCDGGRKRIPPFPAGTTEQMAREKAAHYAERVRELGLESPYCAPKVASADPKAQCQGWVDLWQKAREARRLPSARITRGHWVNHLKPILGASHPKDWTRADFRALSKTLNDKVARARHHAGSPLSPRCCRCWSP